MIHDPNVSSTVKSTSDSYCDHHLKRLRDLLVAYSEQVNPGDAVCWVVYTFDVPSKVLAAHGLSTRREDIEAAADRVNDYLWEYLDEDPAEWIHYVQLNLLTYYPEEDWMDIPLWIGHLKGWPIDQIQDIANVLDYPPPVTPTVVDQAAGRVNYYLSQRASTYLNV